MAWENPLMKKSFETRGWITLASGFLVHITLGTFYLWGSIITYTTSYLQQHGSNVNKDDAGAVFPFTYFAINVGIVFGVDLAKRFGHFRYLFIASFLCGLSVFISAFVVGTFALFVLFYGVLFGLLTGLIYMVPFNTCYMYFPHRKGLVAGVITGGFGFGSAIFIWLIYGIVNPHGEKASVLINGAKYYSTTVTDKYPLSLMILGIIIFVVGSASSFLHLRPTEQEARAFAIKMGVEKPNEQELAAMNAGKDVEAGNNAATADNANKEEASADGVPIKVPRSEGHLNSVTAAIVKPEVKKGDVHYEFQSVKDALQTPFIYLSLLLAFFFTAFGTMCVSQYKNYGDDLGFTDSFLSSVGTVGSIMNGAARIAWGALLEKFSIRTLLIANVICQLAVSFTFRYVASVQGLFFLYVQLGYFLYGAWLALCPAMIAKVYGKKIGSTIYCVTFFGFVAASFLQYFLVKDLKKAVGWGETFWVFSAIILAGFLLSFFTKFHAVPPSVKQQAKIDAVTTESAPLAITQN